MSKITLSSLANLENEGTAVTTINSNFQAIETAIENTLSRDGTTPNQMEDNLDMNSNRIINLPDAVSLTEPVNLDQMTAALVANGNINTGLTGVPVSLAMQPVVNASTLGIAANLLGPSRAATTSIFHAKDYGVVADGVTNDSAALQAAINAASVDGGIVQMPAGDILLGQQITMTKAITLRGVGMSPGVSSFPGTSLAVRDSATTLIANFASDDIITFTGMQGPTFEDFQIDSNVVRTNGAGIRINSAGNLGNPVAGALIRRVQTFQMYYGFYLYGPAYPVVTECRHISWLHTGLVITGDPAYESSGGIVSHNVFFDITGTSYACIDCHVGYTDIVENALIGSNVAVYWTTDIFAAGRCRIANNIIENNTTVGILCNNGGTAISAAMLMIQDNEFSTNSSVAQGHIIIQAGTANWLDNVQITGNNFRSQLTAPSATFISVSAGTNILIKDNVMNGFSGSAYGIGTGGWVTSPILILDNIFTGSWTAHYSLTNNSVVRDFTGMTVAQLGAWSNGSLVYVTDGKATNLPTGNYTVISGGSGVLAHHQNGAWIVGGVT